MLVLRLAPQFLVAGALLLLLRGFASFDDFPAPRAEELPRMAAGIVFTGDFGRVDHGLRLLDAGLLRRLYISGVNPEAGIRPENFVAQFSSRNPGIAKLGWLVDCCVEWGERAENTWQNALDARCWALRNAVSGPLQLITGREHMARARAALAAALPDREILADPVEDRSLGAEEDADRRLKEYLKYLATLALTLAPGLAARTDANGVFAQGCPEKL